MELLHFDLNAENPFYLYGLASVVVTLFIFARCALRSDVGAAVKFVHFGNL
jgi:hypothetical protein